MALANKQAGIGFVGIFFIIVGIIFALIFAMKIVPPYMHSKQIEKIFKIIANDPEMQNASAKEIRASFGKRANIDYIDEITPDDIEVSNDDGHISLSASYSVKVPLAGNASLVLDFTPKAGK